MGNDLDLLKVIVSAEGDTEPPTQATHALLDLLYEYPQSRKFEWQELYNLVKEAYVVEPEW